MSCSGTDEWAADLPGPGVRTLRKQNVATAQRPTRIPFRATDRDQHRHGCRHASEVAQRGRAVSPIP